MGRTLKPDSSAKLPVMSTAQILHEVRTLSTPELPQLAVTVRFEWLRRVGETASDEELRWLEVIDRPLAHASRFDVLAAKWENEGLTGEEKSELQSNLSARSVVRRARQRGAKSQRPDRRAVHGWVETTRG